MDTKIGDVVSTVTSNVEAGRTPVADGLDAAASTLHVTADRLPGDESVSEIAHHAADGIGSAADYVRKHGAKEMIADVQAFVTKKPGRSLAGALALGFLVGRVVRRG